MRKAVQEKIKCLKKIGCVRRGFSALLCVCMMLSMVRFTAAATPVRAVDPPAEMQGDGGVDLEKIPNYDKALHFLIRHWHMDEDRTAQYQGGTTLQSGGRYITVTEGYIIPAAGGDVKYRFYVVNQGTGKLSEVDPGTFPARSNYVESMDPATGKIVLTPYFVLLGEDPVEQFAGWSISTGHDAVGYTDASVGTDERLDERLIITYKANVHLVKGHAFYISDGEIVEGSVEKAVFGGEKIAMNLERDVDWAWVFTEDATIGGVGHQKDSVAVDENDVPYTELNVPDDVRPHVEWMQIHNTNQGLHTDKTAVDSYEDGRTYDVDLKAWYTAGYAPVVGMVLDASGSMGFAADFPEPIRVTEERLGADAYSKLEGKIGQIQREKEQWDEENPLAGYYEIRKEVVSGGDYRLWYFNSAKDDYTKYNSAERIKNAPDNYFAHAVKQSTPDSINFSGSAPVKHFSDFKNVDGWEGNSWGSWGDLPANFSESWGFNLTNKNGNTSPDSNSGFLLDVAPKSVTDFTIAFTLEQCSAEACEADIEILYIGPKVADSSADYFHVYRSGGSIIAKIGSQPLTLEGYFNDTVVDHNFSFVFSGNKLTAYVDGSQAGTLNGVPEISSAGGDTCVVFAPFKDNNTQATYLTVDSIYLFDAALNEDEAKDLSNSAGNPLEAYEYSIPENAFLAVDELALLLDTHKTDNSKMGYNGYSYFVYDAAASTAEYNPLSYYTNNNDVPHLGETDVNGPGWYYVNAGGDWSKVSNTTKNLHGIVPNASFSDTITPNVVTVSDNPRGAAPDVDEDTVLAGNSGANYTPSSGGPIKFYIDKEGYLRCFYGNGSNPRNRNTSYVYELRDEQYVKEASLQRALGDFVTQLNEIFPQSDVAATRFSTPGAITNDRDESYKLVLLDWTHDVTKASGAMSQRWGSNGSSVGVNNYPANSGLTGPIQQYDYVLTGSTATYTGLHAFQKYLAPIMNDEKHPERFLIIFTDGKDTEYDKDHGEPSQRVANELKEAGYTIFTVLLSAGTVAEGTEGYIAAHEFLLSLSGTKDTTTNESREPYFFSIYTAIKQIKNERAAQEYGGKDNGSGGIYDEDVDYNGLTDAHKKAIDEWYGGLNMNTADVLTQIFSKKILSMITQPLEDYVVQDYIDPRFDLVAGIATKKIDNSGLTANITYNSTEKNDYTLHLRVNGEIAIGNEDASEIYATVNLKDGTVTDSNGNVFHAADGTFTDSKGNLMINGFVIEEFSDENGKPLDPSLIITQTRTSDDEDNPDPGEDPEGGEDPGAGRDPGKYYLNIHLIGASRAAIRFVCLFYDEGNQMYYLQWMDQTIPASTYAQTSLSVWRARITLRAKEDFLGGNAVLTNGQYEHMNYVYHTGDGSASSGTERSYWKDSANSVGSAGVSNGEYLSKGFPRVTVNVKLPDVKMRDSDWTLWVGETVDPSQLLEYLAESIDEPLIWDGYMSRYGHSIVPYPDALKDLSLTELVQLSSLYRLHVAIDEAEDSDKKAAAETAYKAYRDSMDAELQAIYDKDYEEYADKVKDPSKVPEYGKAIYNNLRRKLLDAVGIGRELTYYSTSQLMAGLLDEDNTLHGLYLPYAYLNSFDADGGSEGNQAGLIDEQQLDVLGVIRYRWERVNYYTGETITDGGYFRTPGEGKLENGVPSLSQEFTIYDTRTLQYRLTATFWPFPDPSDGVWDNLIYAHDDTEEAAANAGKKDAVTGRYKDKGKDTEGNDIDIRYEAVFVTDGAGSRKLMNSGERKAYLREKVKGPIEEFQKKLIELEEGLTGYKTLEDLKELMKPFQDGEYRKNLYNGVTEMGFDKAIWGDSFKALDQDIDKMNKLFEGLNDDKSNTEYYAQRLAVRDQIEECLEDLRWFTYAVEYLEWCIGVQDTGGKFSHLDRTNDRNRFNYDNSKEDDLLDPDGYGNEAGSATIPTLIKDTAYKWTKEAVGTAQHYKKVEGSRTTHIVRGELAFEMKLDVTELEYLFTTEWKDQAKDGVTYHVKLEGGPATEAWKKEYGGLSSPDIPEELTITITKSDLETLRERAAIHAERGDAPIGTLYYQAGFYSTGESSGGDGEGEGNGGGNEGGNEGGEGGVEGGGGEIDTRLPNPNLSWYPKAVYDMSTGEVTFYTDPRIYDPEYKDEKGNSMYGDNNDYARLLPMGTYTLTPNEEKNKADWWMFDFDDFDYAPLEDYARDMTALRKSHFTDNTADNKANAVNSVYAPYIDAISGATSFQSDPDKYAPPNTKNPKLNKRPADGSVTFYLGTYDYADNVNEMQYLTARVGMGMVKASLKYEMPATGGPGITALLWTGSPLLIFGMGLAFLCLRKDRKTGPRRADFLTAGYPSCDTGFHGKEGTLIKRKAYLPNRNARKSTQHERGNTMKKRAMWRIAALALALVLAAGLAAPAMAYPGYTVPAQYRGTLPGYVPLTVNYDPYASVGGLSNGANGPKPPYQIIIKPGAYTETPTGGATGEGDLATRFWAYQIFAGSLSADAKYPGYPEVNAGTGNAADWEGAPGVLADIRWGSSVTSGNLQKVLTALITKSGAANTKVSDVGITVDMIYRAGERYYSAFGGGTIVTTANTAPMENGTTNGQTSEGGYWTWNADANEGSGTWEKSSNFNTLLETALSTALDNAYTNLTLADLFKAALNYADYTESGGNWTNAGLSDTAKVVSQVLSDFTPTNGNNNKLAEAFAKILYNSNGLGDPEAKSKWTGTNWTIGSKKGSGDDDEYVPGTDHLAGGYYLIVDTYVTTGTDKTNSDFMVGVFADITMTAKSEAPTVDKAIVTPPADNGDRDGDSFEIGEEITFKITGGLPTNYENFDWYYYEFTDTMGKGLTYVDDSVQVYATVRIKNPKYDPNAAESDPQYTKDEYLYVQINIGGLKNTAATIPSSNADEATFYVQVTENAGTGETELKVHFEDLKNLDFSQITLDEIVKADLFEQFKQKYTGYEGANPFASSTRTDLDITLTADSTFTITYKAYINEDAEFNLDGNTNRVKLTYSSDVNDKSKKTDTAEVYVYAYTFGLDLLKYDGAKTTADFLTDAGFSLQKNITTTEYALYNEGGAIAMWISEAELKSYFPENYTFPDNWSEFSATNIPLGQLAAKAYPPVNNITNVSGNFSGYYLFPDGDNASLTAQSTLTTRTAGTYYAIVTAGGSDGEYTLAGWISEDNLLSVYRTAISNSGATLDDTAWRYLSNAKADTTVTPNLPEGAGLTGDLLKEYLYPGNATGTSDKYYIVMMTLDDGYLYIGGLKNDGTEYTLTERVVPNGYDALDESIKVKFCADYYTDSDTGKTSGKLKQLYVDITYTGDDNALGFGGSTIPGENGAAGTVKGKRYYIVQDGAYVNPDGSTTDTKATDLKVHLTAANFPKGFLPGTGGIGVYAFYIGGGLLLAGAAVLLITISRKKPQDKRAK